jgi:glycerophosphoryl diester phosphodiesterase
VLAPDGTPTPLVKQAHGAGLKVHGWTLRKENVFLPPALRSAGGESATGDYAAFWRQLAASGMDGVFTDDPARAVAARGVSQPAGR